MNFNNTPTERIIMFALASNPASTEEEVIELVAGKSPRNTKLALRTLVFRRLVTATPDGDGTLRYGIADEVSIHG